METSGVKESTTVGIISAFLSLAIVLEEDD